MFQRHHFFGLKQPTARPNTRRFAGGSTSEYF
jgi:hypothetical protein